MLNRRSFFLGTLGTGVMTMATACVQREPTEGQTHNPPLVPTAELVGHSIVIGDQAGTTQALLTLSGERDHAPYHMQFSNFVAGPPEIEAANANSIDFALVGTSPPIFGAAAHARFRIAAQYTSAGLGEAIHVPNESKIHTVPDLIGKRVAVAKGTSSHGHLLTQLHVHKIPLRELTLVYLSPPDAFIAFQQNNVDAWAVWDPYSAELDVQNKYRSIANAEESHIDASNVGIASITALNDPIKNSILYDLVLRYARAVDWSYNNVDTWAREYAKLSGLSYEVSHLFQSRSTHFAKLMGQTELDNLQALAHIFAEAGLLSEPIVKDYFDPRYNASLLSSWSSLHHPVKG